MMAALGLIEKKELIRIAVVGVFFSIFSFVTPISMQALVNTFLFAGLLQPILILVLAIFVGLVISSGFRLLQVFLVELLQRRIMIRSIYEASKKINHSDPQFFSFAHGTELVNRALDLPVVQKSAAGLIIDGLSIVLQIVIGLSILAFYHEFFIFFDLVFLACIFVLVKYIGFKGVHTSIYNSKKKHQLVAWLETLVGKRQLLDNPSAEKLAEAKTLAYIEDYLYTREKHWKIVFAQIVGTHVIRIFTSVLLLGLGGYLVITNQITVGQFVAAELIISGILYSVKTLDDKLESFYDLAAGLDKVGELLQIPVVESNKGFPVDLPAHPCLQIENLHLIGDNKYGAKRAINGKLPSGSHLVVTGGHGSGKSRLLQLISGMNMSESGQLLLDNIPIKNIQHASLKGQVLFIDDTQFLQGSVFENMSLGRSDFSPHQVKEALDRVGFFSSAAALADQGLELEILPSGYPLSSGQRVLLALARCLLHQPKIVLIDQGLDVLDPQSLNLALSLLIAGEQNWTVVATSYQEKIVASFDYKLDLDTRKMQRKQAGQWEDAP